jgi:hypothetical protein
MTQVRTSVGEAAPDRLNVEPPIQAERMVQSIEVDPRECLAPWPDPAQHVYRESGHDLVLVYRGVTEREIAAVRWGQAAFALIVEPPLIMLVFRLGDSIPWSVAPCRWNHIPSADRYEAIWENLTAGDRTWVRISLTDADSGLVNARRTVPLSPTLTRAWNAAVRRFASHACSEARYSAALAQFSRRFPRADALLSLAVATSVDGE